jgi:hypothetical protein
MTITIQQQLIIDELHRRLENLIAQKRWTEVAQLAGKMAKTTKGINS